MDFIERIPPAERERLMAAGRVVELEKGELLIRRGERGGDIYLVESGTLEVVDSRSSPEVVISIVGPGAVVGEMAFVDEAPRNADVRAAGPASCRVWEHDLLERALGEDPAFSAAFYRALSATAVERLRALSTSAVVGGIGNRTLEDTSTVVLNKRVLRLSAETRDAFLEADAQLRKDADDPAAAELVAEALAALVAGTAEWRQAGRGSEQVRAAGEGLRRELRLYMVQSRIGALAADPPEGHAGGFRLMAHLHRGRPAGDGAFGKALDAALLALPTAEAFRTRSRLAARTLVAALPDHPCRVMVAPAASGGVLPRLHGPVNDHGGEVLAVDGSREALSRLEEVLPPPGPGASRRLLHEDLARLVSGRSTLRPQAQDFIVVDGLTEYLPDRMVAALCHWCREVLAPKGELVLTGLGPSEDAAIFDEILGWPLVRRDAAALRALVEAAGLRAGVVAGNGGDDGPAVVVRGRKV